MLVSLLVRMMEPTSLSDAYLVTTTVGAMEALLGIDLTFALVSGLVTLWVRL